MSAESVTFNRRAVKPLECLGAGWRLVKERYGLFLGVSVVGVILGGLAPMGLLYGPAMCGIYLCLLRNADGDEVSFATLFDGFNYYVQSLIATLIMMVPVGLLLMPTYVLFMVAMVAVLPAQPGAGPPDPTAVLVLVLLGGLLFLVVILILMVVSTLFAFTFSLIVDRNLTGVEAVWLSMRAAWANIWGVLGVTVLTALVSLAGTLACCVGSFFVLPITFGALAAAYRQIFPADEAIDVLPVDAG